jgi:hypothetical protein
VRKKNRRVVKGGDIVAAMRSSLYFVRKLITTTNTFFYTEVRLYGGIDYPRHDRHFHCRAKVLDSRSLIFVEAIALCLLLNKPHLFGLAQHEFTLIQLTSELSANKHVCPNTLNYTLAYNLQTEFKEGYY